MSYLALARKWRPRTFSQLLGQEHINKPLVNSLNQQRIHHAYLFTGTRGVGKTSVARILAKALNCESGISSNPCLECSTCLAIEQGRFIDLIEIDGASKTRVEDTRDLLDNIQYAPAHGRFKIYLIDEVHMLSQHSFNALLKTLEEPPAHVKFILATTDPQKLPITILSRCLQFNLRHLSEELISNHLQSILQEEQLEYENEAVSIIAYAAQGSMRDALSLLDQSITSCNDRLLASDVKTILGYTQQDYAIQILDALAIQNASLLISLSNQIAAEGGHFQYVIDELLSYFHQISVYQNLGDDNPLINPTAHTKRLSLQFSAEDVQLFYQICLKGREELSLAPTLIIGFNMTLLRLLTFRPAPKALMPALATRPQEPDSNNEIKRIEQAPSSINHPSNLQLDPSSVVETIPESLSTHSLEAPADSDRALNWANIIPQLKLTGLALNALENSEFLNQDGKNINLKVAKGHQSLFTTTTLSRIETALTNYYKSPIKITIRTEEQVHASPAQQKEKATQQKQEKAETALHNDLVFQQLQQDFSAELVKNSIVPLKDGL